MLWSVPHCLAICPPIAACKDITINLDSTGNASVTTPDVDNGSEAPCGIQSLTLSGQTSFTCNDLGSHPVTLTVHDVNEDSASCIATVTVEDNSGNCTLSLIHISEPTRP